MPTAARHKTPLQMWAVPAAALAVILVAGGFLFYWFQLRPVHKYRQCVTEASADARNLLASKAQMAQGSNLGAQYQRLLEQNMYLRSDYNSFLRKCLLYYGLTAVEQAAMGESASSTAEAVPEGDL